MTFDNRFEGIKGSYTFFEDFRPGSVETKKGTFNNVLLNYDGYSDNLMAKSEKIKDPVQMRKDLVTSFILRNPLGEEFLFVKKNVGGNPTFLWELVRDTISFYCRAGKTIKKAEIGGAYNTSEARYDEFVAMNKYFVSAGSGELIEIQNNKKAILKTFPEIENELSAYLKEKKLDFNDHEQMKALALYINELKKR